MLSGVLILDELIEIKLNQSITTLYFCWEQLTQKYSYYAGTNGHITSVTNWFTPGRQSSTAIRGKATITMQ